MGGAWPILCAIFSDLYQWSSLDSNSGFTSGSQMFLYSRLAGGRIVNYESFS